MASKHLNNATKNLIDMKKKIMTNTDTPNIYVLSATNKSEEYMHGIFTSHNKLYTTASQYDNSFFKAYILNKLLEQSYDKSIHITQFDKGFCENKFLENVYEIILFFGQNTGGRTIGYAHDIHKTIQLIQAFYDMYMNIKEKCKYESYKKYITKDDFDHIQEDAYITVRKYQTNELKSIKDNPVIAKINLYNIPKIQEGIIINK